MIISAGQLQMLYNIFIICVGVFGFSVFSGFIMDLVEDVWEKKRKTTADSLFLACLLSAISIAIVSLIVLVFSKQENPGATLPSLVKTSGTLKLLLIGVSIPNSLAFIFKVWRLSDIVNFFKFKITFAIRIYFLMIVVIPTVAYITTLFF